MLFNDRVVVVTGGSRGIGRAIALAMCAALRPCCAELLEQSAAAGTNRSSDRQRARRNPRYRARSDRCAGRHRAIGDSCAAALGPHRLRCNSVLPGMIRTEINEADLRVPDKRAYFEQRIPLGRLGKPRTTSPTAWCSSPPIWRAT